MTIKSTMGRLGTCMTGALMLCLAWGSAHAVTLDFGPLSGLNGVSYTGHVEDGYTISPTQGSWFEAHMFGNPTPDIFGGPIGSPSQSTVQVTGGLFSFASVDLSSNVAVGTTYLIRGLLNTIEEFSFGGTIGAISTFITIASLSSASIDELLITMTPTTGVTSFNLDNIVVNAIPLPAALPLFGTGLAALGFIGWRRRRKAAA